MGSSYDAVGNLTARLTGSGSDTYEYDALEMIASRNFPEETFVYTADDERIQILRWQSSQPTDEEYTLRDLDGKVLTIYDLEVDSQEHWSWRKDYVYRGASLLMSMAHQPWPNHRQHFSLDHLGSPRLVTVHNGNPLEDHHYLGFGRELGAFAGNENLEQRFTGHRRDHNAPGAADDLDYMHARYYSPWLNRFLSVDPVLGEVASPQSWNRYAYANNNPLRFIDPDGNDEAEANLAALGLIGSTMVAPQGPYPDESGSLGQPAVSDMGRAESNSQTAGGGALMLRGIPSSFGRFLGKTSAAFRLVGFAANVSRGGADRLPCREL